MAKKTVVLTFDSETLALSIEAPDLSLDFVFSMLDRAYRVLEVQEKIITAQQVHVAVRQFSEDQVRTGDVLKRIKLQ